VVLKIWFDDIHSFRHSLVVVPLESQWYKCHIFDIHLHWGIKGTGVVWMSACRGVRFSGR